MPVTLRSVIKRVPSDCEAIVERTRDRLSRPIRDALRGETALKLGGVDDAKGDGVSVPVRVVPGLPVALANVELDEGEELALALSRWRSILEALKTGSNGGRLMVKELEADLRLRALTNDVDGHLAPAGEWAEALLRRIEAAKPLAKILIDGDVLGIYTLEPPRLLTGQFGPPGNPRIEMYWAVIGLVAEAIGVGIEDLTVVVLAHELAHAYTHRGSDINGLRWATDAFFGSERALFEGLAQYYTYRVCLRLKNSCPGALGAFKKLLVEQSLAYQGHTRWIEKGGPEEVRFAMIEARRCGVRKVAEFNDLVEEARSRWQAGP